MALYIPLDAGPLNLPCYDPGRPASDRCSAWLDRIRASGAVVVIPAITDYEVRRELIRLDATTRLDNLSRLRNLLVDLAISQEALDIAADFWAFLRKAGKPTAGPESWDADAILAGMAATIGGPGDSVVAATTNVRHLGRCPGIIAREWWSIG